MQKKPKSSNYNPSKGWTNKYLNWLTEFMNATGMGVVEMSKALGIPRQSMTYWFKSDNLSLIKADDIMKQLGYILEVSYKKDTQDNTSQEAKIKNNNPIVVLEGFNRIDDSNKRLAFLRAAMERFDLSISDIARGIGVEYGAVQKALRNDNWTFWRFTQIAEAFDLQLVVKITLKETNNQSEIHKEQ